jgi:hypothetical protein
MWQGDHELCIGVAKDYISFTKVDTMTMIFVVKIKFALDQDAKLRRDIKLLELYKSCTKV